jgi:hypothetical protein
MAHGLPIVSSDLPTSKEIMGDFGLYFKNGNIEELSQCLEEATQLNWKEKSKEAIDIANDCVPFGIGDWGNSFGSSNMQELGLSSIADLGNTPLSEAEGLSLGGDDIYGDAFELGLAASDASELSEDNQQSNDDFGTTDNTDSWHNTEDICNMDNLTN